MQTSDAFKNPSLITVSLMLSLSIDSVGTSTDGTWPAPLSVLLVAMPDGTGLPWASGTAISADLPAISLSGW